MSANESKLTIRYDPFKEIVIMEKTHFTSPTTWRASPPW